MTTADSVQIKSPWSHRNYRDTLRIFRCWKFFLYFGRHHPFFGVLVALVRACDHNNAHLNISGLSLVTSALSCLARSGKQRHGKGRKKLLLFLWNNWVCVVWVPWLPRIWEGPGTSAEICDPSKVCCTMANPWMLWTQKGCPWYPVSWQEQWCMERRDSHAGWGCCEVLWNLIGNKIRFDRIYIHRLFDLVILQLLWVAVQQQWGTRWNPAVCALPK